MGWTALKTRKGKEGKKFSLVKAVFCVGGLCLSGKGVGPRAPGKDP